MEAKSMDTGTALSIIVSWRDRLELRQALPGLRASAAETGGELLIVNLGGDPGLLRQQLEGHDDICVIEVEGQAHFNKPVAHNVGAHFSTGRCLFFCDCDILLDPTVIRELLAKVENTPSSFGTLAGVTETEQNARGARYIVSFGYELRLKTGNGRQVRILDHEEDAQDGTRMAPGLLLVPRSSFEEVNGYNSQLDGWGWEDQDMVCRLTLGAGLTRINQGRAIHISHDDVARVQAYPAKDRWESRDRMFRRALANYDQANFLGTYQDDVQTARARVARRRPERIGAAC
jgi:hypothetical protein